MISVVLINRRNALPRSKSLEYGPFFDSFRDSRQRTGRSLIVWFAVPLTSKSPSEAKIVRNPTTRVESF